MFSDAVEGCEITPRGVRRTLSPWRFLQRRGGDCYRSLEGERSALSAGQSVGPRIGHSSALSPAELSFPGRAGSGRYCFFVSVSPPAFAASSYFATDSACLPS